MEFFRKIKEGLEKLKLVPIINLGLSIFFKFEGLNNIIKFNYFLSLNDKKSKYNKEFEDIKNIEVLCEIDNNEDLNNLLKEIKTYIDKYLTSKDKYEIYGKGIGFYDEYMKIIYNNNL